MRYVYAAGTLSVRAEPEPVRLVAGEAWDADDPFVRAHPDLFTDAPLTVRRTVPARVERPVEQATRAPGEKRTTGGRGGW